jgi:hypothetical protein
VLLRGMEVDNGAIYSPFTAAGDVCARFYETRVPSCVIHAATRGGTRGGTREQGEESAAVVRAVIGGPSPNNKMPATRVALGLLINFTRLIFGRLLPAMKGHTLANVYRSSRLLVRFVNVAR